MEISPLNGFDRHIKCRPDKSITHRAVMLNAAVEGGRAEIKNALLSDDCLSTIDCMRRLGAEIETEGDTVRVIKGGIRKGGELYVGNSGTTVRILSGLLASQNGKKFILDGDDSIRRRPMDRIIKPLSLMGARISGNDGRAPLFIEGAALKGINYDMPVASAQVKSAVLLAGLNADGVTTVTEPQRSRDHTERMLKAMGAPVKTDGRTVSVTRGTFETMDIKVAGDISSAAFAMALAAGLKGGRVIVEDVGVNPTRTGIIDVLKAVGVKVEFLEEGGGAEPVSDILVENAAIKPRIFGGDIIPRLIDEIPVLAVLMAMGEGIGGFKDAAELKVKETNRISTTVNGLKALGVDAEETPDGMIIRGKGYIEGGGVVDSCGDHRIAMAMAVAMALSRKGGVLKDAAACSVSYPGFYEEMFGLSAKA